MHTQHTLQLTDNEVTLIEQILINSSISFSDMEVVDELIENGIDTYAAEQVVKYRRLYKTNRFEEGMTPLVTGLQSTVPANGK
jgi:hypothetical protein